MMIEMSFVMEIPELQQLLNAQPNQMIDVLLIKIFKFCVELI